MKTKKSLLAGLCSIALATSVGVSAVPFNFASAASARASEFTVATLQDEVEYGQTFEVPTASGYDATVIAPNGKAVVLSGTTVTADQLGFYTVTYTNGTTNAKYSFNVFCSIENAVELVINNEAKVPTYVKTGTAKQLPGAKVGYYDDGEFVELSGSTITLTTDTGATITPDTDYTFDVAGSTFVTYTAKVGTGSKYVSKTFEIKVQDDFEDTKAPTLTVTGVPKSGNVNMAVKLPSATATDTYDSNVDVQVLVQQKVGNELINVKKVTVNDEGIATAVGTDDEVFDNKDNMTFYPTEVGEYKVTYKAVDDEGNDSSPWIYTVSVSDKKAPTMTVDQSSLPANWGYNSVTVLDDNGDEVSGSTALTFKTPEFFDNYDEKDEVTLEFRLKDPESNNVVSFSNINADAGSASTICEVAGQTYKFSRTEDLVIDLKDYIDSKASENNYQVEGAYTVIYAAQDKAGNRVQRSYTINVTADYKDVSPVTVEFRSYAKSVVASATKEVEYVVPSFVASSNSDTNLSVVYTASNGTESVEVAEGEILKIKKDGTDYKLVAKDGEVVITDKFYLEVVATSDGGNTNDEAKVQVKVIVPGTGAAPVLNYDGEEALDSLTNAENTHNLTDMYFTVTGVTDYEATDIEIAIADSEGKNLPVNATVYNVASTVVVKDISFVASKAAEGYTLTVKASNENGQSVVKQFVFDITASANQDPDLEISATLNSTSASAKAEIKFAKKAEDYNKEGVLAGAGKFADASNCYIVLAREISGGKFSVNGNGITAYNAGRYTVKDKFIAIDKATVTSDYAVADDFANFLNAKYDSTAVVVKDNSTVQLEVQGTMPSYSELSTSTAEKWVKIPVVAGFSQNEPASKVTLEIKSPKGLVVAYEDCADNGYQYQFKPTENGTYTLTYKVKVGEKDEATFVYNVKAGDLVLPVITMSGTHSATMKAGDTFSFLALTATDNKTTDTSKLTVTKTIYGPDGAVVGTSINGEYTTNAGKTTSTTLSASGKYTVKYTVKDEAGNTAVKEYDITVTSASSNSGISLATLSTIMIIVGVLLIAGVVAYLFIFRRPKKN